MKVAGALRILQPPARVAEALHDPAVLHHMLPACEGVEPLGPGRFRASMARKVGLLTLRVAPEIGLAPLPDGSGLDLTVEASSRIAGSLAARLCLGLEDDPVGTRLTWDGTVEASGLAQRLLAERQDQVAERVRGLFITLKRHLAGG
jgi:carbon monoxide dehydrogenase subunit G